MRYRRWWMYAQSTNYRNFFHSNQFRSQGDHGIEHPVYLSLPCVLTSNGVSHVVKQILTESEAEQLQTSAAIMHKVQENLKF